jgi:Tfp pilus assembly PilM family ATPase
VLTLRRKVLCLDWDRQSVRVVVARVGGGQVALQEAHAHRIPPEVDPDQPESLGAFVRQVLRGHRIGLKRVVVHIPRDRTVMNHLTLPPTPPSEVAAAVRFQALKELPFPLDEAVIDFVVRKRDERGWATGVLLAAATREVLEQVRGVCQAAGLEPLRIGLRPYANLLGVRHLSGLGDKHVLFVDVGPTLTEIDVMDCGRWRLPGRRTSMSRSCPALTRRPRAKRYRRPRPKHRHHLCPTRPRLRMRWPNLPSKSRGRFRLTGPASRKRSSRPS